MSRVRRLGTTALCLLMVAAAGCGSDSGGSASTAPKGGRASPDTQGALLTILNYGRAASAKEVCPLLSTKYRKEIGAGDAAKCGQLGQNVLCPCQSGHIDTSSLSVNGNTATASAARPGGSTIKITLVREGNEWKIDKLDPPRAS